MFREGATPSVMENLVVGARWMKRSLALALLGTGLGSYACGGTEPTDVDGLGGSGGGIEVVPPATGGTDTGTGGSPVENLPPFESCTLEGQGTQPGSASLLVDDFEDGDAVVLGNGFHGNWFDFDDDTAGTQTPSWDAAGGQWLPEQGGTQAGGYAMHVVGGGYSYWGSGQGVTPLYDESARKECLFDASAYDGITFWIKGEIDGSESSAVEEDRGVLKFGFVEAEVIPIRLGGGCDEAAGKCYDWHKVRITPSACWVRHSYTFDEFEQDGWGIDKGEFNLDELINFSLEVAQGNTFDYWVDELAFFSGDPPEDEEICDDGMGGGGGVGGAGGP